MRLIRGESHFILGMACFQSRWNVAPDITRTEELGSRKECVSVLSFFGEGELPMCAERESDNVLRLLFIVTVCTKSNSTIWIKVSNARREGNTEE